MPLILGANSLTGGYEIDNSLRFENTSTDGLTRTISSSGNRRTWTWSGWVKRSKLTATTGDPQILFNTGENTPGILDYNTLRFNTDDKFLIAGVSNNGATTNYAITTNAVYRDVSAWYHVVVAFDSTQGTSSDRIKLYINGEQVTSFSSTTYPSLNYDSFVNFVTRPYYGIGDRINTSGQLFAGYMSEINFIDGQQLAPSDFGEFDEDSGIWKPIAYEGTYGTNGFYLEFKDSSALGDDTSGNSNDFTVNNLTSIDQTTDTPTNNFATLNPLSTVHTENISSMLSNGNVDYTPSGDYSIVKSTIPFGTTGKWYVEAKVNTTAPNFQVGIQRLPATSYNTNSFLTYQCNDYCYMYSGSDGLIRKGSASPTDIATGLTTWSSGSIVAMLFDADNNEIKWYVNDTLIYTLNLSTAPDGYYINDGQWVFACSAYSGYGAFNINFGNPAITISSGNSDANGYGNFEYPVPSGYYALCTANLAEYG